MLASCALHLMLLFGSDGKLSHSVNIDLDLVCKVRESAALGARRIWACQKGLATKSYPTDYRKTL